MKNFKLYKHMATYDISTDKRFYQRRSIEEFTSEHEVIGELYHIIARELSNEDSATTENRSYALNVMNGAFYLCLLFEQDKGDEMADIFNYIDIAYGCNLETQRHVLEVTIALLSLYKHKYETPINILKFQFPYSLDCPAHVPNAYKGLVYKYRGKVNLDFSGKQKRRLLENAYDKLPLDEKIATTLKMMEQIRQEREEEIREKDARIQALETKVKQLEQTIGELKTQTKSATPAINEEDEAINRVINYKTICEYVANEQLVSDNDAKVIRQALREIPSNAHDFPTATLNEAIDRAFGIRRDKRQPEPTIINNNTEAPADKPQEDEPQDNGEDKMPAELMAKVREKAQDMFDEDYCTDDVLNMVYAAARKCQAPQHFALLYLLCKDYRIVKYTNCHRQFAHIINTMLNRQEGENGYLIPNSLGTSKSNITHYFEEPDKHQHVVKEYRYFYAAINRVFAEAKGVKLQRDKRCLIGI